MDPLTEAEVENYALGFPWSSMGNPDACRAIPGLGESTASGPPFHSCLVDARGPFMRFGLCAPRACTGNDVALGLGETLRRIMPPLPPEDPIVRALHATTDCGDERGYPWTAGTWAVVAVCCALAALVAAASVVELLEEWWRVWQQQKQQGAVEDKGQPFETTVVVAAEAQDGPPEVGGKGWRRLKGMLLCFSLQRNWAKLTAPGRGAAVAATSSTPQEQEPSSTAALDGVRALSMAWVVFGHTLIFADLVLGYANHTPDIVGTLLPLTPDGAPQPGHTTPVNPGFMGQWGGQAATNAYLAVDTFLFLSGFLAVRGFLLRRRAAASARSLLAAAGACLKQAPLMYLLRYLRLTPAYALVLFVYWRLLGVVGGRGPMWRAAFKSEYGKHGEPEMRVCDHWFHSTPTYNGTHTTETCEQTWYANFLYANNFITSTNAASGGRGYSCMPASWYLAVDMQLFLLAPPVAFLAAACPRLTVLLLGIGVAASATYTAWAGTVQGWNFAMIGGGEGFSQYFVRYYIKPWTRAVPSLIGMGLAILLFHADGAVSARKDGRGGRSLIAWAVAFALIALAAEGARGAYTTVPSLWTPLQYSLYLALSRIAWGLGLALLTHRLFLGGSGGRGETRTRRMVCTLTYPSPTYNNDNRRRRPRPAPPRVVRPGGRLPAHLLHVPCSSVRHLLALRAAAQPRALQRPLALRDLSRCANDSSSSHYCTDRTN